MININQDLKNQYKPLVSILINCFNGEQYLRQAIESVIQQTYENWEIVFWDNRSIDDSAKIINSFNDKRIKYYLAIKHTSLYHARNLALSKANGELIAFLDVDDYWLKQNLSKQVKLFNDTDVGFSCANFFYRHEEKKKYWKGFRKLKPDGNVLGDLLKNYSIPLVTLILRRSILKSNNLNFNINYNHIGDFDIVIRLASMTKLARTHQTLGVYRIHKNNISGRNHEDQILELEDWHRRYNKIKTISNNNNYKWIKVKLNYQKGIRAIYNGSRHDSLQFFFKLPTSIFKFKLLLALLIPLFFLKKLRLF